MSLFYSGCILKHRNGVNLTCEDTHSTFQRACFCHDIEYVKTKMYFQFVSIFHVYCFFHIGYITSESKVDTMFMQKFMQILIHMVQTWHIINSNFISIYIVGYLFIFDIIWMSQCSTMKHLILHRTWNVAYFWKNKFSPMANILDKGVISTHTNIFTVFKPTHIWNQIAVSHMQFLLFMSYLQDSFSI